MIDTLLPILRAALAHVDAHGPVAQSVEPTAHNGLVAGSNPVGSTNTRGDTKLNEVTEPPPQPGPRAVTCHQAGCPVCDGTGPTSAPAQGYRKELILTIAEHHSGNAEEAIRITDAIMANPKLWQPSPPTDAEVGVK